MPKWMKVRLRARLLVAAVTLLAASCVRPASQAPAQLPSPTALLQPSQTPRAQAPEPTAAPSAAAAQGPEQEALASPSATSPADLVETAPPAQASRLVFRLPREVFAPRFNLDGNYQVFSANLDGSDLTPLTPGLGGDLTPLDVSTDGKVLVASGKALYIAGLDGSEPLKLAEDYAGGLWDTGAFWLADGSAVVYIGVEAGERKIYLVKQDGSSRQTLTGPGSRPLDLLPEEVLGRIAWRQGAVQNGTPVPLCDPACYAWTGLHGGPEQVFPREVEIAALAPVTGLLAFHAENKDGWELAPVAILQPDGERVAQSEPLNVCSLAWSPDGKRLLIGTLYGEAFCGWYRLWAPGEPAAQPVELPAELPSSYAQSWSPDGGRVLFEDWSGAWVASLEEGIPEPVLEGIEAPPGSATHILWAP